MAGRARPSVWPVGLARRPSLTPAALQPGLLEWAGYGGVLLYLSAFALLQGGVIRGTGYAYILINLAAACLVLSSLYAAFNPASAAIQVSYIAIGLFGLARRYRRDRRILFSPPEAALREVVFPGVAPSLARRFLDAGAWTTLSPDAELTREGEPVETLFYIADGRAEAFLGERHVGRVEQGFVGEMNALGCGPASATVRAAGDVRVFTMSGEALRGLCRRDPEMRSAVERGLARETRRKLSAANTRIAAQGGGR